MSVLKDSDLEIEHLKGSGPGGQNRNKRQTGVRITHLPTGLVVVATERRNQSENLRIGLERMEERIRKHFYRPPRRRPTKKTKSSQQRRLDGKRRQGNRKKDRGQGSWE